MSNCSFILNGRCPFKQYLPSKPSKYGVKFWCLVDSRTSYLLDTDIYLGKTDDQLTRNESVGESVVWKLVAPYRGSNRTITMDNFFTSVPLALKLWQSCLNLVGTIRVNKKEVPEEFKRSSSRAIGSSVFGFSESLTLTSFVSKKNKSVLLLSTYHHDDKIENGRPAIIDFYNKTKSGVDTLDQLIE